MSDLHKYIKKRKSLDKNFTEKFDKGYEEFKINELKDFDISEYLAQVLKDGDKDELSQALENIEKSKT